MTATTAIEPRVELVDVPGATLHVEVRGEGTPVVLHGAPMDARPFAALANDLARDHLVVTSDPRGIARSTVEDRDLDVSPDTRADDVARTLVELDLGPAVVVGSSGGAVSALALAASRPELVAAVVAHEPPLAMLLDDRDRVRDEEERMVATYVAGDRVEYWRQFLATASIELPPGMFEAWFAQAPEGRDAEDEQFGVERMQLPTTFWSPPVEALRDGPVPITVGIGRESTGQLCDRTSRALAEQLGVEPTLFPGDHAGFTDDPTAFAATLREVLAAPAP